jgi:hypothetical protein
LRQDDRKNEWHLNCVVNYATKHKNIINTTKLGIDPELVQLKDTHREKVNDNQRGNQQQNNYQQHQNQRQRNSGN